MGKRINIDLTCWFHTEGLVRGVDTQLGKVGQWSGVTIYRFVALPPNPIVGPVVTLEQVENEVRFTEPSLWDVKSVLLQEIVQSLHPQQKTKDVID